MAHYTVYPKKSFINVTHIDQVIALVQQWGLQKTFLSGESVQLQPLVFKLLLLSWVLPRILICFNGRKWLAELN